jgi:hypothetical protein
MSSNILIMGDTTVDNQKDIASCHKFLAKVDALTNGDGGRNRWGMTRDGEDVWHTWDADCMERLQLGPLTDAGAISDWTDLKKVNARLHDTYMYYWWAYVEGSKKRQFDYLSFLLSPESPYTSIFPWLVYTDPEQIVKAKGFIIRDYINAPAKLLFSFLQASRMNRTSPYVLDFQDKARKYNVNPRLGFLLTTGFKDEWTDQKLKFVERSIDSILPRASYVLKRWSDADPVKCPKTIAKNSFRSCFDGFAESIWYDTPMEYSNIRARTEEEWCQKLIAEYERRQDVARKAA